MNDNLENETINSSDLPVDNPPLTGLVSDPPDQASDKPSFRSTRSFKLVLILVSVFFILITASVGYLAWSAKEERDRGGNIGLNVDTGEFQMSKFASEAEFKEYFENSQGSSFFGVEMLSLDVPTAGADLAPQGQFGRLDSIGSAERVSSTNVQVATIDEPDILKTDGENIFFSGSNFLIRPFIDLERSIAPAPDEQIFEEPSTKIVQVFPPQNIENRSQIVERGEMLLTGDNLVIFANVHIVGYNIADKANPTRSWSLDLNQDDNTYSRVVSSRLYQDKVYIVTSTFVRGNNPCPIPLTSGNEPITVPCIDVFYPGINVNADSTYTVMRIDPITGIVEDRISFVGSTNESVVYMSENSIYVTNTVRSDEMEIISDFFVSELNDLLPQELIEKIKRISEYDISKESKMMEYQINLEKYLASLSKEDRERVTEEMGERMENYLSRRSREMVATIITKINVSDLEIVATGSVSGSPLNQFSLDEYQQNLRIATTSNSSFGPGSVNDVFVLDQDLDQIGSVMDMGLTERIYSVRFIEDKGYVVTFRQIDPFYVLDLSNPREPQMKGELKIPGFSSYLHPLEDGRILGIGREDSSVKLSIFDVSDPSNPIETQNLIMQEFSSEVLYNHRAFLIDDQHKIFFIPAGNRGYVFNYAEGLQQQVVIEDINAQRALYINNYLYVVGDKIVVLDENTWQEVARVDQ